MNNTFEHLNTSQLIEKIGETDQLFLTDPTPELAVIRAGLRLTLSRFSHQNNERLYFLTEAAALLEIALMNIEDAFHQVELSIGLSNIYLEFYQVTHETRYLLISSQILKPLSHHEDARILLGLARVSAASQHLALTKHWLGRLMKLDDVDINHVKQTIELNTYKEADWFNALIKQKLH